MKLLLHKDEKRIRMNVARQVVEELPNPENIIYYIHRAGIKIECSKAQYDKWPWKHRSTSYEVTH